MKDVDCIHCGIIFGVPDLWDVNRRRDHASFYCPNGHGQHYTGESDIEKANRLAREAQAEVNRERHLRLVVERERDKAVLQRKRIEKRIAAGVCICCGRTFENLARHMKSKHKNLTLSQGAQKLIEGTVVQ